MVTQRASEDPAGDRGDVRVDRARPEARVDRARPEARVDRARPEAGLAHSSEVDRRVAAAPAPGQAPLPAKSAAALLEGNAADPEIRRRPALKFGDLVLTHADLYEECLRFASVLRRRLRRDRPPHVGVLLDNTPDYVIAIGGAGLVGACVVGLNHTRRGEHLARDISFTDVQMILTEPRHLDLIAPIQESLDLPGGILVSTRYADADDPPVGSVELLEDALEAADSVELPEGALDRADMGSTDVPEHPGQSPEHPGKSPEHPGKSPEHPGQSPEHPGQSPEHPGKSRAQAESFWAEQPDLDALWVLLFTSGTSSAPKAVRCTQRRLLVTGNRLRIVLDVGRDDVGYIAMPLFHSNSLMVGLAPALIAGASVGLARRFSASRFLPDVRRYGATWFNYTGKPLAYLLATPEKPDDWDNPLRLAYGNEGSPQVVESVSRRFGLDVVDVFGSTEGAIALDRSGGPPRGSIGKLREDVAIVDSDGNPVPVAELDSDGRLSNADVCVGELVNTAGVGPFEGYYRNDEAMAKTTRRGWYWSGDLGYVDADGWVYFAGRTADWLRVDGENFPAGPIDAVVAGHPDVLLGKVYGVPDVNSGDQVMVALVMREGSTFDPEAFARWLDAQPALSPKWHPRYVRVTKALPQTPSNKVLARVLQHEKFRSDRTGGDEIYLRSRGEGAYHRMSAGEEEKMRADFEAAGRMNAWDL